MPDRATKIPVLIPVLIGWTCPSAKANCTIPVCLLLYCTQDGLADRPQAVGMEPEPNQHSAKSRLPVLLPASVSPKAMVFCVPSITSVSLFFELRVKIPRYRLP